MSDTSQETLLTLLTKMRPMLVVAGVKPEQVQLSIKRPQIDTVMKAFDWLHDLYLSSQYLSMVAVYALRPEEIWDRYLLFEIEGLAEQKLLEKASKRLVKAWRTNRPRLLGKIKKVTHD